MTSISDTRLALLSFQEALNTGMLVNKLDDTLVERCDEISGGTRYAYAKVVNGEVQSLAMFGPDEPVDNIECYSVNYVVGEKHQGRGLASEILNRGIERLLVQLRATQLRRFYLEAIVEQTNVKSIVVAEKLFSGKSQKIIEKYSNKPALQFKRLIVLS